MVWRDDTPGNFDIFFAFSTDNGQTFSTPDNLSNSSIPSFNPQISSEDNNVYVVWGDRTPGNDEIFFAVSNDNGQTFSTPDNLSVNTGASFNAQISSEGNNVYVVWQVFTTPPDNEEIFFAFSTDNGQTFSTPDNLSEDTVFSGSPQISSQGNDVYVVWVGGTFGNFETFFVVSTDNGQTFSTPDNLSENTGDSRDAQISSSGNNVYVVWKSDNDIFFAFSTDNGLTFSFPDNLSEGSTGDNNDPQISSEGNNVYVVWSDNNPRDIFFAFSTDNGLTFSFPDNLSVNTGFSAFPQITSEGNNVYVVWTDDTPGNFDIFYTTNNQDFGLFESALNLSHNVGRSIDTQISSSP